MTDRILTLEEIAAKLADRRLSVVSDATGLSYPTLKKLADGDTNNYELATLRAVSDYLTKKD